MRASQGFFAALIIASLCVSLYGVACNGANSATGPAGPQPGAANDAPVAPAGENGREIQRPRGAAQPVLPWGRVELEAAPRAPLALRVEVAATDRQREMGLMYREQLG